MIAKELIIKKLQNSIKPLAVHELNIIGYSENNLATRLSELARERLVSSHYRRGEHYKEWYIIGQGVLL